MRWLLLPVLVVVHAIGAPNRLSAQQRAPQGLRSERVEALRFPTSKPLAPYSEEDAWFGRDKLRHTGSSAAIQLMGYGLVRIGGASRRTSLVCATVVTAAAGIGKELHDKGHGGRISSRDLLWDGIGILAGTVLLQLGDGR